MGLRPQTLCAIADSPVGLAAYFLDHDASSYDLIARVFDGQSEALRATTSSTTWEQPQLLTQEIRAGFRSLR